MVHQGFTVNPYATVSLNNKWSVEVNWRHDPDNHIAHITVAVHEKRKGSGQLIPSFKNSKEMVANVLSTWERMK